MKLHCNSSSVKKGKRLEVSQLSSEFVVAKIPDIFKLTSSSGPLLVEEVLSLPLLYEKTLL